MKIKDVLKWLKEKVSMKEGKKIVIKIWTSHEGKSLCYEFFG